MKRILLVLCLVLLPVLAHAGDTPFDGFYIGAKAGLESYDVDVEYDLGGGGSLDDEADDSGFVAGAYLGYGRTIKNVFYLGWETDAMYHGMDGEFDYYQGHYYESLDMNWSLGVKARLGGVIADRHLAYGLVGLRIAGFDYRNDTGYAVDDEEENPVLPGFTVGGGYEFAITKHLIARAEIAYTAYAAYELEYVGGPLSGTEESISPSTLDYTVGLAWNF
ncbi:outer membrane beta-barrel protein [Desulfocurvibacter africanus]|uniref:OmpA domain protein transmembrane region-containing protein n=1 Tax=Desulfocurvibacter africanus subsp. africanus str. Walvis Bay TaxID=690850 RepID=F3Z449_DESAF|nr:outer membrane beta-barrel protein [Desulfocurvibacter africanus]EGJ51591.1 OmpA domain protein transmembrane region-containing protein [Desulfocurvibacter africanus subsp. africanus str. Walvis Bay]